jgi:transcriptional regulator with XRE-family HTH domain
MSRIETATATAKAADDWVSERLPVMEALRSLGLRDRQIARALGISRVALSDWAGCRKPIPPLRHATLIWLVGVLIGRFGKLQLHSRYARRSQVARTAAQGWLDLARDELLEDLGADFPDEILIQAHELGKQTLARLEAR